MRHEDVRAMLSAGDATDEVRAHLATCADCTAFDETLSSIKRAASDAYAETPPDLADKVLSGVRTAAAATVVPLRDAEAPTPVPASASPTGHTRWEKDPSAKARQWWHRAAARAAVAAAVAGAVAAAALTLPGEDANASLVGAAGATEQAKTARFSLTAEMRFEPNPEISFPVPDLDAMRRELRNAPRELRKILEAQIAELERRRPAITEVSGEVHGNGVVVFPDRMQVHGTMRGSAPGLFADEEGVFEAIVIGDRSWVRTPATGGKWARMPSAPVSIRFDFTPVRFIDLIRLHGDRPEDLGLELLDGERVRHWRFRGQEPGVSDGRIRVDVWVGEDGLLRRAVSTGSSVTPAGTATFTTEARFFDFGADVSVEPPAGGDVVDAGSLGTSAEGLGFAGGSFTVPEPPALQRPPAFSPPPQPSFEPMPPPTYPTPEPYRWSPEPYPQPTYSQPTYDHRTDEPSPYPSPSGYPSPTPSPTK